MISVVILFISFILLVSYFGKNGRRPKNYPPGPYSWPIVGNMFQMSPDPYKDYMKLKKVYGDIFAIDLGSYKTIIVNGSKLIKEASSHTNIAGRPQLIHFMEAETGLPKGIIMTEGKEWTEQRRFTLKTLRDFGFGKKSMESTVHEEIKELIESFKADVNKPIYTSDRFNIAVFNALWTIVAGERHSQSENKMQNLIHHLTENLESVKNLGVMICFPWLAKMLPQLTGLTAFRKNNAPIFDFMKEVVSNHKQTFQSGNNRDFLDCYLEQMKQTTDPSSSFYKENADSHLVMALYDLFLGGTETTSTSLTWTFLLLAHHQQVQQKLHDELKKVVGDSRLPSFNDKTDLPYLEAVIMEVMRFSSLVPSTFRRATEDVEFHGYFIPKGTAVISNLYGINYDTEVWGDPEHFRPERFMSDDGTVLKNEALLPFGYGRRFCPGESLARDQLFLFTASLFNIFKVSLGPDETVKKVETILGGQMRYPKPCRVILKERYAQ